MNLGSKNDLKECVSYFGCEIKRKLSFPATLRHSTTMWHQTLSDNDTCSDGECTGSPESGIIRLCNLRRENFASVAKRRAWRKRKAFEHPRLSDVDPDRLPRGRIGRFACPITLYASLDTQGNVDSVVQTIPANSKVKWHPFYTDQIIHGAFLACTTCTSRHLLHSLRSVDIVPRLSEIGYHAFDVHPRCDAVLRDN